jgi:AcrR family transcriptional regulator
LNEAFRSTDSLTELNDPFKWYSRFMTTPNAAPLRGRQAQAARNDATILAAARDVFLADPDAPIAAVAERAGVGIGALYHRYASKEDLLRTLCRNGQEVYLAEARRALELAGGSWQAYTEFLRRIVAADTHGLVTRLAGRFTPTTEMFALGEQMEELGTELLRRAQAAGDARADVTFLDVGYLLELLSMLRVGDAERTAAVRQRHLAVIIDGLRAGSPVPLPGEPPTAEEQVQRWIPGAAAVSRRGLPARGAPAAAPGRP